jgi:hypothetical protein
VNASNYIEVVNAIVACFLAGSGMEKAQAKIFRLPNAAITWPQGVCVMSDQWHKG